jgi:hypothetical protein
MRQLWRYREVARRLFAESQFISVGGPDGTKVPGELPFALYGIDVPGGPVSAGECKASFNQVGRVPTWLSCRIY